MSTIAKRLTVATLIVALVATLVGVFAFATDEQVTPSAEIKFINLEYRQNVSIWYAVEATDLPSGATIGVEYTRQRTKGGETTTIEGEAVSVGKKTINGNAYDTFAVRGIGADEMTADVYVTPYVELSSGERIYGAQKKSSVLQYAYTILGKIENQSNPAHHDLVESLLAYGNAAQLYSGVNSDKLAGDTYYQVKLDGGTFADGFTHGLYKAGEILPVTVGEPAPGYTFNGWTLDETNFGLSSIIVAERNATYVASYNAPVATQSRVLYGLNGGTLSSGNAYDVYTPGTAFTLPTPTKDGYAFSGWYTTENFERNSIISVIPASASGEYVLYAKWNKVVFDYTASNHGMAMNANNYSSINVVTNAKGEQVVRWDKTSGAAASILTNIPLSGGKRPTMYEALGGAKQLTYTITLSAPTGTAQEANFRIMSTGDSSGLRVFTVNANGSVTLGIDTNAIIVSKLTSDKVTFSVCVDFEAETLSAYDADGRCIATTKFNTQTTSASWDEWYQKTMTRYYDWYSKSSASGTIDIHNFSLCLGNSAHRTNSTGLTDAELTQILSALQTENSALATDFGKLSKTVKSYKMEHSGTQYAIGEKWAWKATGTGTANAMRSNWGILSSSSPYALTQRTGTDAYGARLMLNDTIIADVLNNMNSPEYEYALVGLLALARTECDGVLPEPTENYKGMGGTHNYDASVLSIIEAKALMYRIMYERDDLSPTEELERDMYGYQAIVAIKNYLLSLEAETKIGDDASRYFGHVMYTAAEVYDWCKPLLTAADKDQIIRGVVEKCCAGTVGDKSRDKMSVGYPPVSDQTFTGTSSELMILRDYLSFAVAIYDEDPSWYNYIASGIITMFVPGRVYYFESGMTHQGVSNYIEIRHMGDLYASYILQTATGNNPYTGIENTMISVLGHQYPDEVGMFEDGDGNTPKVKEYAALALMASAICENGGFGDNADTLYTWFYKLNGFNSMAKDSLYNTTYSMFFILAMQGQEMQDDEYEGLDAIQYNGSPLGQMISRSEWGDPDAAAVFVKIKERHTSNHEQEDAGTFQIYYKGILTGDSGFYGSAIGSDHYTAYHTATVAHNGILVYDTSNTDPLYTGGQRSAGLGVNHGMWNEWYGNESDNYDAGRVTGVQYGYKDAAKKLAKYAYLAGDITVAYDTTAQVNHVERRTLTVYTDNADFPMVFFVYDDVEAKGTGFETKFLLHVNTANAPTVSGNTVTINNGLGKLVLTCLTDYARIDQIGGRGTVDGKYSSAQSMNYCVNGVQLYDTDMERDDGCWGRVEIVSTSKATKMVNVMYVTDAGQVNAAPAISHITGTGVEGGVFGNVAAVFMTSRERVTAAQSFTVSGSGEMEYYVSGVAAGNWTISVGGTTKTVTATEDGGLLVFTAPAGTVTITPAK